MNAKPISDLRRRLLQDMTNRNFGDKTRHDYIRHIETFAKFLGRSPDTATGDDVRRFQAQQIEAGAQPPKMNTQASALRFFFTVTLGRASSRPSCAARRRGIGPRLRRPRSGSIHHER